jgi:acyl-CoA synthetase (AMP-forming)/AMP-acid ligase II
LTLPALLGRNAASHGGKPAIVTAEAAITHRELEERSTALAARLVAAGVARSSRVGLLAPNGIDWVVVAAAVWRVGAVLVPLSTLLRRPELEAQLRTADVSHLVAVRAFRGRSFLDDVAGLDAPLLREVWALDDLPTGMVDTQLVEAMGERVRPADDLVVLFTSGSRGTPKGVLHTHGGALRAVASSLGARCVDADTRLYVPMPFFWTGGLATGLLSALVAGATLLTEAVPEPGATLALLERERATLFRGWPDQAAALAADRRFADADLSTLGDASLPALLPLERRSAPGARPNIFGMTETFGPWCSERLDVDLPEAKRGSCGRAFEGIEVKVSPDGENILRGICGRTRDKVFDADGWYATGDLGRVDQDGYVWFLGRADDMFKVKGATVYPSEVETAIRAIPGVQQAHVTDVSGAVGALVVTTEPLEEIVAAARQQLSSFKVPSAWVVTADADDVPLTPTSKIDKAALQALFKGGTRT